MTYSIKRIGRTWAVMSPEGHLVEGGFFGRDAAQTEADRLTAIKARRTGTTTEEFNALQASKAKFMGGR